MLDDMRDWFSHPFSADMSALHWFAFIGLLIFISVGWRLILRAITT